jgi:hypothetical protein
MTALVAGHGAHQPRGGRHQLAQVARAVLLDGLQHQFVDAADHGHRHLAGQVHRGPAFAAAAVDRDLDEVGDLVVHPAPHHQARHAQAQDLDEQRAQQHRVLRKVVEVRRHGLLDLRVPGLRGVEGLAHGLQREAAGGFVERDQALGLGAEVFVESAARDGGLAHDVGDGGLGVALGGHGVRHALEQPRIVLAAEALGGFRGRWFFDGFAHERHIFLRLGT